MNEDVRISNLFTRRCYFWDKTIARIVTPTAFAIMFKKIKDLYKQYKPYIKGDLIMYGFLIFLVFLYLLYRLIF